MTRRFVHRSSSASAHAPVPGPVPRRCSPGPPAAPAAAARSGDRARSAHARPGVRSQCSIRPSASRACVRCRASQFPARLRRGSRSAVGRPLRLRQRLTRLLPARTPPAPATPPATTRSRRSLPAPSTPPDVSRPGPPAGCPRATAPVAAPAPVPTDPDAGPPWPSTLSLLQQGQPTAHPALVLAQQVRRFHLGQAIVSHQRLHDPCFFQLPHRTLISVEPQDRRLRRPLVHVQNTHAQGRPAGHLLRRRQPLEAVEQVQLLAPARRPPPATTDPNDATTPPSPLPPADRPGDNADTVAPGPLTPLDAPRRCPAPCAVPSPLAPHTEERKRGDGLNRSRPLLPPCWGRRHFNLPLRGMRSAKTCFRRCPATDNAWSRVAVASAGAAADNGPPGPARAVTPDDRPSYKNADSRVRPSPRTAHNSPAGRTSAGKNPRLRTLGADPRTPPPRQLTPRPPPAAGRDVADTPDATHVGVRDHWHWPGNAGSPSPDASDAPPAHRHRCNSGTADEMAQTTAHTP